MLATRIARRLKRLVTQPLYGAENASTEKLQIFSIGIYDGPSPFGLKPADNITNPVITANDVTDVSATYVADPFMIQVDAIWYMFFEIMNQESGRGEISVATSTDGFEWTYQAVVLAEPFHLSYPNVFEWMGDYYMVPESFEAGAVRLYKSAAFPAQWQYVGTMLNGDFLLDATPFRFENLWWMFVETAPHPRYDTLRLYFAEALCGKWHEHPYSPVIQDNSHAARPAGSVISLDNILLRPTQDCVPDYGTQVRLFEIDELSTSVYRDHEVSESPLLTGTSIGWNADGMHHINAHRIADGQWIACVDGWFWQ